MVKEHTPIRYFLILSILTACSGRGTPLPPAEASPPPLSTINPTQTLAGTLPTGSASPAPEGTEGYPWWNDSVFYEIFVRSFYDSNNDGVGDFDGVTEKLTYLRELGITGIYLMPIFPTYDPSGYLLLDYITVNPDYGTLDDFRDLLSEAHRSGIRVIIDFPINGTSIKHPWFQASQDPDSSYRNWYIWADADPGYSGAWGQRVWYQAASGYFYSALDERIAELNFTNPEVTSAIEESFRFWMEQGVDGFRLDAIKHLIEEGQIQVNTASTHEWLRHFRMFLKETNPDCLILGEVWETDLNVLSSYTKLDELDLAFDFAMSQSILDSARTGTNSKITSAASQRYEALQPHRMATFLTNHDMNRTVSQLGNDINNARVAASLLLTSPGVPFIYFGEEIGLSGTTEGWSQACHPMQWSKEAHAGFSTTIPWSDPWCASTPAESLRNVLDESYDPDSLLSHYRTLIRLRNEHPALRVGEWSILDSVNPGVYASLAVSSTEAILVMVNLTGTPVEDYGLSIDSTVLPGRDYTLSSLMGGSSFEDITVNPGGLILGYGSAPVIPAHSTVILALNAK